MSGETTVSTTPSPRQPSVRVRELRVAFSVGGFAPGAVPLLAAPIGIGREPGERGLSLEDRRVSRRHVVVEQIDGGWVAVDQGSHNGTWVDGVRCERAALRHGSVIRAGGTLLLFLDHERSGGDEGTGSELIGPSAEIRRVRVEANLAAGSRLPALVTGETGVGKERVARELHRISGRAGPFVALNCAALSAALAESELFGHVAGAFTGAVRRGEGLFEAARGGTLLLDEIGEMPLDLQPKLLRALALGEVRAVGAVEAQSIDALIVAASNRDLDAEVQAGRFRADLLARLAGWRIEVPPLRVRRDDILPLAKAALAAHGTLGLGADAAEALLLHDWPFNVRELEHALATAAVRAAADGLRAITPAHLPGAIAARVAGRGRAGEEAEGGEGAAPSAGAIADQEPAPSAAELRAILAQSGYNVTAVARHYGKERRQVYRWVARYGIDLDEARRPK